MESEPWLTTSEVVAEFPIGRSTLLRLRRQGKIGGQRFGREMMFLRSRIESYLAGDAKAATPMAARLPPVPRYIRR